MTHLSPQISHLVAARPMSVTMGNAIRQLKLEISGSDIDLPEQDVSDIGHTIYSMLCINNRRPSSRRRMRSVIRLTIISAIGLLSPIK